MRCLFLDCEWTDTLDSKLVSLAVVSEDCLHRFYSEVELLPQALTDWVRAAVCPLLEYGSAASQLLAFARNLRDFLEQLDDPFVLFECRSDGALVGYALTRFDLPDEVLATLPPAPKFGSTLILRNDVRQGIVQWLREHPEHANHRLHAGVGADALRCAFVAALQRPP